MPPRDEPPAGRPAGPTTIFDLLTAYHRSLENMKAWLAEADLDPLERASIADAWQEEMVAWFREHGYCFVCHRPLDRCRCEGPAPPDPPSPGFSGS